MSLELFSGIGIGVIIGWILGKAESRFSNPRVITYKQALEDQEKYYLKSIHRLKADVMHLQRPPELANITSVDDAIAMLGQDIGQIKGIPKWLRPFMPAVQAWIRENPEQIKAIAAKLISKGKAEEPEDLMAKYADETL